MSNTLKPPKLYLTDPLNPQVEFFLGGHYEGTTLEEADFILYHDLLTARHNIKRLLRRISKKYRDAEKKVIILVLHDFEEQYQYFDNLILLRFSVRKSLLANNEWVVPYLFECLEKPLPVCSSGSRPSIGFCGSVRLRKEIVEAFEMAPEIQTDFIKRDKFWGGDPHNENLREDFYQNMERHPFNLTPRGGGNFSMRFYQALAAGRIPVLVDTDTKLPLEHLICWEEIIILGKDILDCMEKMLQAHKNAEVEERQSKAATVFHQYLSHHHYFKHVSLIISDRFK